MNPGETRFPLSGTDTFVAEFYHLGYPAMLPRGVVPERTTDQHGPLQATGAVQGGRTHLMCPNEVCGARMFFTSAQPLTAISKRIELEQRNAALSQGIARHMGKAEAGEIVKERALQITRPDRVEYAQNEAEIARLRALGDDTPIGVQFHEAHSGGMVARLIPVQLASSVVIGGSAGTTSAVKLDVKPEAKPEAKALYTEACSDCSFSTTGKLRRTAKANLRRHRAVKHPLREAALASA